MTQSLNHTMTELIEFKLPELGENIEQGDLVRLMVEPGTTVNAGQSVMELETDKAVVEVPSSVSGTVQEIRVKEGEKIKVGQVIFTVDGTDGKPAASPAQAAAPAAPTQKAAAPASGTKDEARQTQAPQTQPSQSQVPKTETSQTPASPAATSAPSSAASSSGV